MKKFILTLCFTSFSLFAGPQVFNSLDPVSVAQALAFYELYPESKEGKEALKRAETLLKVNGEFPISQLARPLNRFSSSTVFTQEELALIERLGQALPTRKLKGAQAKSEKEILDLPAVEIDLGRALLFSQSEESSVVDNYAAVLDLMAIQVLSRISPGATPEEKIKELNRFIFEEHRFRFPPQSLYARDIDLYTFLPAVMDNHLGVCLGVTTLYLALAERIELPLEIITPPGHIYLRYRDENKQINIETTARGIDIPDEKYLSINLKELPQRTKREVVGMTHVNKASTYLYRGEFEKAAASYARAIPYLEDDVMTNELWGLSLLLSGQKEKAEELFRKVLALPKEKQGHHADVIEDYFANLVDEEGIKSIFIEVDEKKSTILAKQKELLAVADKYPKFRSGLEQIAISYLQLNRFKEGLIWLTKYHELDSENPKIEYYLSVVHGERQDFGRAWQYLRNAEDLTRKKGYMPKVLKDLRKELQGLCPE